MFGRISKYLIDAEIIKIFEKIIIYIIEPNTVGRDIYLICAKQIFKELSGDSCRTVGKVILPGITKGIKHSNNDIIETSFEIFNEYVFTFNYILIKNSNNIINKKEICNIVLKSLNIDNDSLRKTLTKFLGNFSLLLTDKENNDLTDIIINNINSDENFDLRINSFSALNSIGKSTASKNTYLINMALPLILNFANVNYLMNNMVDYDKANELVESALYIIETFILNHSSSLKDKINDIINTAIELIEYDPNYSYENTDDIDMQYEDEYNNEYEAYDIEDSSWKVRRASVRILSAITKSRVEIPNSSLNIIIEKLVFCLREHEETTKEDLITCLCGYLRNLTIDENRNNPDTELVLVKKKSISISVISDIFENLIEKIVKLLKSTNKNTFQGALNLLNSLALPASIEIIKELDKLKPNINEIFEKNISNFSLTIFEFFNSLLKSISYNKCIIPHLDDFINWMIRGFKNDFYKINIESSKLASQIIRILREVYSEEEIKPKLEIINSEIIPIFQQNDLDHDLKTSVIKTASNILFYMLKILDEKIIEKYFDIFLEKFKNENLVILCNSLLIKILQEQSEMKILSVPLKRFLPLIVELINKKDQSLRQSAIDFLCCIIKYFPNSVVGYENILIENLLEFSFDENFVCSLYETLTLIVKHFNFDKILINRTINNSIKVLENPKFTKEKSAEAILNYNYICSQHLNFEEGTLEKLIKELLDYKQITANKSKLISYYSKNANMSINLIKKLLKDFNSNLNDSSKKNVLMLIGDISINLGNDLPENISKEIFELNSEILNEKNIEINPNAAISLAKIGVYFPSNFIKTIQKLRKPTVIRYSLSSIREFIRLIFDEKSSKNLTNETIDQLFDILLEEINCEDENIGKLCGECLGLLSCKSDNLLNKFINFLDDKNDKIRSGLYFGIKFIIFKNEEFAHKILEKLIKGLSDSFIETKINSYNSLISFAHENHNILKFKFAEIWVLFENDYMLKPELVSTVDIGGGMRIKIDKGLPIRESIFSTIKILVDNIPEKINFGSALQILLNGLDDEDDVANLSYASIIKIIQLAPGSILNFIEDLIDKLKKIFGELKSTLNQKDSDSKKYYFFVLSSQRLCNELKKINEMQDNPKFLDFSYEIQAINIK